MIKIESGQARVEAHSCGGRLWRLYIHPKAKQQRLGAKWCDKCGAVVSTTDTILPDMSSTVVTTNG